jgi:hypothetical protein
VSTDSEWADRRMEVLATGPMATWDVRLGNGDHFTVEAESVSSAYAAARTEAKARETVIYSVIRRTPA